MSFTVNTKRGLFRLVIIITMVLIPLFVFLTALTMNTIIFIVFIIIAYAIAIATAIIMGWLYSFVVTIAEDGLIISHRGSTTTIPVGVVVGNNLLCIEEVWYGLRGYRLHVVYGNIIFIISLEYWQGYDLINMMRSYWGWVPPKC
jgi:hypothetical protein